MAKEAPAGQEDFRMCVLMLKAKLQSQIDTCDSERTLTFLLRFRDRGINSF